MPNPTTQEELRAKFERAYAGYPFQQFKSGIYKNEETDLRWIAFQGGHASRDPEVEALKKEAETAQELRKETTWPRREEQRFFAWGERQSVSCYKPKESIFKPGTVEPARVTWSSFTPESLEEANDFALALIDAIALAKRLNEEILNV